MGTPYATRSGPSRASRLVPGNPGRDERNAGLERDARSTRVPTCLVLLAQPFSASRSPRGTSPRRIPRVRAKWRCRWPLRRASASTDGEGSSGRHDEAEGEPEQLRLRHEPEEAMREERKRERPGIEVRPVVGRDHEATFRGARSRCRSPGGEHDLHHRPAESRDEVVEPARTMRSGHAPQYRGIAAVGTNASARSGCSPVETDDGGNQAREGGHIENMGDEDGGPARWTGRSF